MRLLLATGNAGKIAEYRHLLSACPLELLTLRDLETEVHVAEAGATYEENARLKAVACAGASGMVSLADDSGLEVDALGGEPGVHSARYAGDGARDRDRVALLLKNLAGVPWEKRTARFRCIIAIATPEGEVHYARGACEGIIALGPTGDNGFGYDPVFFFPEFGKTMAELPMDLKNRVSHRGRATANLCPVLDQIVKERDLAGTL